MKKQYVLEEKEYLSLCNQLEKLDYGLSQIHRKLNENDKGNLKEDFAKLSNKINQMMKELNWS